MLGGATALLTFVVIGGGPTGVEMAGAIAELARRSVSRDFRSITPALLTGDPDRSRQARAAELPARAFDTPHRIRSKTSGSRCGCDRRC